MTKITFRSLISTPLPPTSSVVAPNADRPRFLPATMMSTPSSTTLTSLKSPLLQPNAFFTQNSSAIQQPSVFSAQTTQDFSATQNFPSEPLEKLREWQRPHASILINAISKFGAAVDCSDMGTGKTYTACAIANALKKTLLVICPRSAISGWREVSNYMQVPLVADILTWDKARNGNTRWVKYKFNETRSKATKSYLWGIDQSYLLVFDEAHQAKGQDTQNSKLVIAAKLQRIPTLACSATLACNPLEMKASGFLLGLHNLQNFYSWALEHGAERNEQWGGFTFDKKTDKAKRILHSIHQQIFPARGTRIKISDLGDKFPETLITAQAYDLGEGTPKLAATLLKMKEEVTKLKERTATWAAVAMVEILRARMETEIYKVPLFVEMFENAIDEGYAVPIFLNFKDSIKSIVERLKKHKPVIITGESSDKERRTAMEAFQADKTQCLICNIAAGGQSISLHDVRGEYPRLSLISPNYSAIQMKQVLGRPRRDGGKSKSIQKIIFAKGTIEEEACDAVRSKLHNLDLLNDGDFSGGIF